MWSVWSKTTQLYLSASCSMVKAAGQPVLVVPHPVTLPLDRVLLRITEAINDSATNGTRAPFKKARLQVTLGGSICSPLPWQVPTGVNNWKELALLAHSTAAQQLGLPVANVVCEWSPAMPGVLAAMPQWWLQSLQDWASAQHAQVASIQPLWAIASNCQLARNPAVQGLCIYEDDGAITQTSPHIPLDDVAVLKMKFSLASQHPQHRSPLQHGPKAWAAHWHTA